jgi:hypothetical protein
MYSLRQIGQDMRKVLRGLKVLGRYLTSKDHCEVGLGLLSATPSAVRKGQSSRYVVKIANAGRQPLACRLTLQISTLTTGEPPAARYAQLTRSLTLPPRMGSAVVIDYDWIDRACCSIDGVPSSPDAFWRGCLDIPQLYAVTALLYDLGGQQLDGLTVYQELTG